MPVIPKRGRSTLEQRVRDAITTGQVVDLEVEVPERNNVETGATWGPERSIRGELLSELLTEGGGPAVRPARVLRLQGARITGKLDLEAVTVRCPVSLQGCYFDEEVILKEADVVALRLSGCHLPGLSAQQIKVSRNLELNRLKPNCRFTVEGKVDLKGAHVRGRLDFGGAILRNPHKQALAAEGLIVDQDMFCAEGFETYGEIRLEGARIGGWLNFGGATLCNPGGLALVGDLLTVGQAMVCNDEFHAGGEVRLVAAHIGTLDFDDARLRNPCRRALIADRVTVDDYVLCRKLRADGEIRLISAQIKGRLVFNAATLCNPGGCALYADRLTVGEDLYCQDGFHVEGTVDLSDACLGGLADSKEAWPEHLVLDGLTYDRLTADPPVSVRQRLRWLERSFPQAGQTSMWERFRSLWRDPTQYSPQPYEQLAATYRRVGRPEDARTVLIAK